MCSVGRCGLNILCVSTVNSFTVSCCCDEAITKNPREIVNLMEKLIRDEIERTKPLPLGNTEGVNKLNECINENGVKNSLD